VRECQKQRNAHFLMKPEDSQDAMVPNVIARKAGTNVM
jgi:hypothetical protein